MTQWEGRQNNLCPMISHNIKTCCKEKFNTKDSFNIPVAIFLLASSQKCALCVTIIPAQI